VPGSADEAGAAEAEYRPLLFSIAYGMTGSAVVNPDKLRHIGPVSDVARLPEKE
jgi:hypothetical protein